MGDYNASRPQCIAQQLRRITKGLQAVPPKEHLGYLKGALLSVEDLALRQALEDLLLVRWGAEGLQRRHIVALVHGIRTRAEWFEPLGALLAEIPGVTPKAVRYGYFDSVRFLIPFLRRGPIKHLKAQLALIARENEDACVSVIAHSYGTYAICKLLEQEPGIRFYRLVLCGSVVPPRFEWHRIAGVVDKRPIINECGTRDVWPVFASTSTWGYGASGTYGFEHTFVMNRFHDLDHRGFFARSFYEKLWLPLWQEPELEPALLTTERPATPKWIHLARMVPIKWLWLVAIGAASAMLVSLGR